MLPHPHLPHLAALCLALSTVPFALAHEPAGTPKHFCEDASEDTYEHEYVVALGLPGVPPLEGAGPASFASASTTQGPQDAPGGAFYRAHPPGSTLTLGRPVDGSFHDMKCPQGLGQGDGHAEWAIGGALLGASAMYEICYGAYIADHTPGSLIWVYDEVLTPLGAGVHFYVYADYLTNVPPIAGPDCGDFESDYGVSCVDACPPGFPPGSDGTYQVYVSGFYGHVSS